MRSDRRRHGRQAEGALPRSLSLCGALILLASQGLAATLRVPTEHPTLQAALDAAADGDTVLVAPGEYVAREPLDPNRIRNPFDPPKDLVVRSEAGAAATVLRLAESPARPDRGSVVLFRSGETARTVLEGFTITGGRGSVLDPDEDFVAHGGGVGVADSSPTLRRLILRGNLQEGLHLRRSSSRVEDCEIAFNFGSNGVGVVDSTGVALAGCVVKGHDYDGGGVSAVHSSLTIERCLIAGNRTPRDDDGGGIGLVDSTLVMRDSRVLGNQASGQGGGFHLFGSSSATLIGCIVAGNRAGQGAGALLNGPSTLTAIHTTFHDNVARYGGGAIGCYNVPAGEPEISGCIVWENLPAETCGRASGSLFDEDPRFIRPAVFDEERLIQIEIRGFVHHFRDSLVDAGDYRLGEGSPAIEAGDPAVAPLRDIDGNPRCGAAPDLGAHERCEAALFRRGDVDGGGTIDLSDPIRLLDHLFLGGAAPACAKGADANDDGELELSDAVFLLGHLFLGGPGPPAPHPGCGEDPTPDGLGCPSSTDCG